MTDNIENANQGSWKSCVKAACSLRSILVALLFMIIGSTISLLLMQKVLEEFETANIAPMKVEMKANALPKIECASQLNSYQVAMNINKLMVSLKQGVDYAEQIHIIKGLSSEFNEQIEILLANQSAALTSNAMLNQEVDKAFATEELPAVSQEKPDALLDKMLAFLSDSVTVKSKAEIDRMHQQLIASSIKEKIASSNYNDAVSIIQNLSDAGSVQSVLAVLNARIESMKAAQSIFDHVMSK